MTQTVDPFAVGDDPLVRVPQSAVVDPATLRSLLAAARGQASSVALPRASDAERLARARSAADAARDVADALPLLDPYGPGSRHARLVDLVAVSSRAHMLARSGMQYDAAGAADRLELARQADAGRVSRAVAGIVSGDLPGLMGRIVGGGPSTYAPSVTPFLDAVGVPVEEGSGRAFTVSTGWAPFPAAAIDPPELAPVFGGTADLGGTDLPWHTSAWAVDVSEQLLGWTVEGAREVEWLIEQVVNLGLESVLLADLLAGATPAADFGAAEAVVGGVWPTGADLIVVGGADGLAVRREYAAAFPGVDPGPSVIVTGGMPAGKALVTARAVLAVYAQPLVWLAAVRPGELGLDMAGMRYGVAGVHAAGAVASVDLTAAP